MLSRAVLAEIEYDISGRSFGLCLTADGASAVNVAVTGSLNYGRSLGDIGSSLSISEVTVTAFAVPVCDVTVIGTGSVLCANSRKSVGVLSDFDFNKSYGKLLGIYFACIFARNVVSAGCAYCVVSAISTKVISTVLGGVNKSSDSSVKGINGFGAFFENTLICTPSFLNSLSTLSAYS